eukprot:SAG31_NODE_971_length_10655_cov_35.774915_3_plen_1569_part_00
MNREVSGPNPVYQTMLAAVQTMVTFVMGPFCVLFMATVFVDIIVNTEHTRFGYAFWVMVVFPGLSFMMSCYMLISYWVDSDGWTQLRKCVMFANIPMCCFFALILMGQSAYHQMGLSCWWQGYLGQVFYLQMNMWHTMTVVSLYRLCETGTSKFMHTTTLGIRNRTWQHILCWGVPVVVTTIMVQINSNVFTEDIWGPELRGIGWCGVRSEFRVMKAIFVNSPQLFTVSFYAQFYFYIHHMHVDPEESADVSGALGATKLSTSRNVGAAGREAFLRKQAMDNAAAQQRLYMTIYIMSFLTNTVLALVSDNMSAGYSSDLNLLVQASLVTPSGFFIGLIYMRTSKPLLSAYYDAWIAFQSRRSSGRDEYWREKRAAKQEKRARLQEEADQTRKEKRGRKKAVLSTVATGTWNLINTLLMFVVGIWVWTPMEFLGEQTSNRTAVFFGLIVWSAVTVFPFYWFSLERVRTSECLMHWPANNPDTTDSCVWLFEYGAQAYFIFVFVASALAVWNNRDNHALLMIEGPVRTKGIFKGIGMGFRLNSCRNSMGMFTLTLEFYQTWGLVWTSSQMKSRYSEEELPSWINETHNSSLNNVDNATTLLDDPMYIPPDDRPLLSSGRRDQLTYYIVVAMCIGWAILYSLPVVITTISVGNRRLVFEMQEAYRKYLWFMSGAGFLTILKALTKVQFCVPHPLIPDQAVAPLVSLTDHSIECWGATHLRMVAVSLLCLAIFFPSASLTTLFRYDDEDDRCPGGPLFCGCCGPNGKGSCPGETGGCVLGGEDTRWIHLWRRVEYMVKGMWVFTGYRLVEYGRGTAVALFAGSMIIVFCNSLMQPSNLKFICRGKLQIHMCNCWTTATCVWAATVDNQDQNLHFAILFPGWIVILSCLWGYEAVLFKNDVFRQPIGDEANILACQNEAGDLRRKLTSRRGVWAWGAHALVVRLIRMTAHADAPVQVTALRHLVRLCYEDQFTTARSFFMGLTPTDPTVKYMFANILPPENDAEIRNLSTRCLIVLLQENVGNKFGLPVTFHQIVMAEDAKSDGQITEDLIDYALDAAAPRAHRYDAALLLVEMCKADSNKLVKVLRMMPALANWMQEGSCMEQFLACHLVAMASNRFDLAAKIIESPALAAAFELFQTVASVIGKFNDSKGTSDDTSFRKDQPLPSTILLPGVSLPRKLKENFMVADLPRDRANIHGAKRDSSGVAFENPTADLPVFEDDGVGTEDLQDLLTLDKENIMALAGDVLHDVLQIIVELGGASRAIGRRQILETGALEIIVECMDFHGDDEAGQLDIHDDLLNEACRAAHSFLSGRFGMDDIALDPDFSKYWDQIVQFKKDCEEDEDWEAEFKFDLGMSPIQRRKAHIICAFQKLPHNSVGAINDRRVIAYMKKPQTAEEKKAAAEEKAAAEAAEAAEIDKKGKPEWMDMDEDAIYEWNWAQVGKTEIAQQMLAIAENSEPNDPDPLRFNSMDILSKICEHRLEAPEISDRIFKIGKDSLHYETKNRPLRKIGSTICSNLVVNRGKYREYGERKKSMKGKELFHWAGKVVWVVQWWYLNSDGQPDFLTGDSGLSF